MSIVRCALLIASLLVGTLTATSARAQPADGEPITIGTWGSVESAVLSETRRIMVATPAGYENSEDRYPVLYLLDGDGHFHHTTGLVEFLSQTGVDLIPDMIVVAIPNTDRTRDLTPPAQEPDPEAPTAGGADRFAEFLRDELIPHVDRTYRTAPYRVLIGHSYGGLFAVHTLVHHPEVFDAWIAISPSMQYDEQRLVEQAEAIFAATPTFNETVYMTVGNEGGALLGGARKLEGVFSSHAPAGFDWQARVMDEETHMSVVHRSTRQGLEYVFRHWGLRDVLAVYDVGGIDAIHAHFARAQERYGLDRSTPGMVVSRLGFDLMWAGRLDESRAVLEHDPKRFPPVAMVYGMLGDAYEERGDRDDAVECYLKALEANPTMETTREKLVAMGITPPEPPAFEVAADVMASYVGRYETDNAIVLEVVLREGALRVIAQGQQAMTLSPKAADRFHAAGQPFEIVFRRGDDGAITALAIEMAGEAMGVAQRTN